MLRICGKLLYLSSSNLESFPDNSHNRLTQGPLITKNYSATELGALPLPQKMTSFTFSPCGNFSKFCLFRGDQLFLCMLQNIFSHRPPLEKSKQKFLISLKKAEFTELPSGCCVAVHGDETNMTTLWKAKPKIVQAIETWHLRWTRQMRNFLLVSRK